jgi:FKBP-type peptidyl-prolyl cis-trans isomerase (trigger factor)
MAYDAIMEAVEFPTLPTELVDKEITTYVYDYIDYMYGDKELSDAEIKTIFDEQYDTASEVAEDTVQSKLVLEYICRQLNVQLTYGEYKKLRGEDYKQYADYYYYYMGITSEEALEEYYGREQMALQYKHDKILKILPDKVVFE